MSNPTDAETSAGAADYETAERASRSLPGQLARIRQAASRLRERLEQASPLADGPTARERAALRDAD